MLPLTEPPGVITVEVGMLKVRLDEDGPGVTPRNTDWLLLKVAVISLHCAEEPPDVETLKFVGLPTAMTEDGTVAAALLLLLSPIPLTLRLDRTTTPPIVPPPLLKLALGGGPFNVTVPVTLLPATT
jgi:hypothetical protein